MKIRTLIRLTSLICAVLTILTAGLIFIMNLGIEREREYSRLQREIFQLGYKFEQASNLLTMEAQRFAVWGEDEYYKAYQQEINDARNREKVIERLKELGITAKELELIEKAKSISDALAVIEIEAMEAARKGDIERAQRLVFDTNYDRMKNDILTQSRKFREAINMRAQKQAQAAKHRATILLRLVNIITVIDVLLIFYTIYFFSQYVWKPTVLITEAINRVSSGHTDTKIPYVNSTNETGALARAAKLLRDTLSHNRKLTAELEQYKNNLEEEVTKRTADLESANAELEEFTYRASHDLLSPVISSLGLLQTLEGAINANDQDKVSMCLAYARKNLDNLDSLIRNITILMQIKNKDEKPQDLDIKALVADILSNLKDMPGFDRLDIQTDIQLSGTVRTEKKRLETIIENLLSNAVKYQDTGKENPYIKIAVKIEKGHFILKVEDNGIGIPVSKENEIFDMFNKFHPKRSGSGLGLYMARKSAEALHGEISFQRKKDGAIFLLDIPLPKSEA